MSDTPRDPTNEHDERDERLAALLETEPLDEVTRARLVRTAMAAIDSGDAAEGGGSRRAGSRLRWLSAAAAIVVVLAVGLAVFARNDSDSEPTAARASRVPSTPSLDTTTDLTIDPEAADGLEFRDVSNLRRLGELGDVGSAAKLRRAIAGAEASAPARESKASDEAAQATSVLPRAATTGGCVPSLPGDVVGFGSGTAHGQAVTVYLVKRKDGSRVAVTVDANCTTGEPVPI